MADKSITLSQSENSSSAGRKFTAYVTGCDTKHYEGSWTVPNSYNGIGVSINSTYITVWNENSSTSDITATFTWTSSKLSTCKKTLEVTASRVACKGLIVDWIVVINDDSKRLLKSVTGDVNLWFSIGQTGTGHAGEATFNDDNPEDGKIEYNPTGTKTIPSKCSNIENIEFRFYDVSLDCSFSGNIPNFTVSGSIEYKINSESYTTLTSINNYTVSSSGSSATIGQCNVNNDTVWKLCNDGDTLYLKHIITMKYGDYCPTATIKLYGDNNFTTEVSEGTGGAVHIRISVTDWKDIPESNRKKFGSYSDGGNNITISKPNNYNEGYASWSGNNYDILGGIGGADGEYSFSITICGQTYTKKYTKKTSTVTYTCPTASFNVTKTKCDIYSTTAVFVNVTDWGSVTSGNYDNWGSKSGNNLKIVADADKDKNYSYEIDSYDSRFKNFSVTIKHEKASTCSDNSLDDVLELHLKCVSSNTTLSSITISPNYGNFVTTFNKVLLSGNSIEIYIKNNNCTQNIAAMNASYSPTTQDAPIWRSNLDMPCNGYNCNNSCSSVSFTIGWRISGTVNISRITANGTTLTGSESNTFTLNPCTSSNFNISVDLY